MKYPNLSTSNFGHSLSFHIESCDEEKKEKCFDMLIFKIKKENPFLRK